MRKTERAPQPASQYWVDRQVSCAMLVKVPVPATERSARRTAVYWVKRPAIRGLNAGPIRACTRQSTSHNPDSNSHHYKTIPSHSLFQWVYPISPTQSSTAQNTPEDIPNTPSSNSQNRTTPYPISPGPQSDNILRQIKEGKNLPIPCKIRVPIIPPTFLH